MTLDVDDDVPATELLLPGPLLGTPAMDVAELLLPLLLLLLLLLVVVVATGTLFWLLLLLLRLADGDANESLLKNISRLLCNWFSFE